MAAAQSLSDDQIASAVRSIFTKAEFLNHLGITFDGAGYGWCKGSIIVKPEHRQQHGYVHAGVISTLADHVAGGAARSVVSLAQDVLTVEFKINFLSPAQGDKLTCEGKILKAGKQLLVAESEVYSHVADRKLVAKCTETLVVLNPR